MSDFPASWATAPIGDVTIDCRQRVPDFDEQFQYIDIGSIDRKKKTVTSPQQLFGRDAPSRARKLIQGDDVLVSMTRPNLNAVALVPQSLNGEIASTGFDVLRATGVDPRWIFYLVRSAAFIDRMSDLVQGALYPAVRSKDVRGFEAPIAPRNEQTRIADRLDAVLARVDACRDRLDRIPAVLIRFRQSVLAAATSGKLTEDWGEESAVRDKWRQVQLGEVARDFSYGSAAKSSNSGAVPVLRMGNIQGGSLDWSDLVYTSDPKEIAKYQLAPGDVLFNRTNRAYPVVTQTHYR